MIPELFDQEIDISRNTCGKCETLCIVIDKYNDQPYFKIRFKDENGWKREKSFFDNRSALDAWREIKGLKEV